VDRDDNGAISALEILNFLRDNKEYSITEQDCESFIKFFDQDQDGKLDFDEFLQIIRPCEDTHLKDEALERTPLKVGRFDYLPANQENIMSDLFISEILYLRKIEEHKEKLKGSRDYSLSGVLKTIDVNNEGGINVVNLKDFFANHFCYLQ